MKRETQNDLVLAALRSGRALTQASALDEFGCARLAARILELRRAGHNICKRSIITRNGARIAVYWLGK